MSITIPSPSSPQNDHPTRDEISLDRTPHNTIAWKVDAFSTLFPLHLWSDV